MSCMHGHAEFHYNNVILCTIIVVIIQYYQWIDINYYNNHPEPVNTWIIQ